LVLEIPLALERLNAIAMNTCLEQKQLKEITGIIANAIDPEMVILSGLRIKLSGPMTSKFCDHSCQESNSDQVLNLDK
jgi:hypothetical protein